MTRSTTAAGTITQAARGTVSLAQKSAKSDAPVAPRCSSAATASAFWS